ncbi:MAG: hypothetical protein IH608_01640 [Proteobacteria bacterium]|nr:hypothetical protein [Pseudomonadota bacterium]
MKNPRHLALAANIAGLAASTATAAPAPVLCGLAPDREAVPAGSPQTVMVKIALDAPEFPRGEPGRR